LGFSYFGNQLKILNTCPDRYPLLMREYHAFKMHSLLKAARGLDKQVAVTGKEYASKHCRTIQEEEVIKHTRAITIRSHDIDSTLAQATRNGHRDMLIHI